MLPVAERDPWVLFEENREAVVAALRRGECEAILPAARTFLDDFAEFLHQHQLLEQFGHFPDDRARRSIPTFFFCFTLLSLPLLRLSPLADSEGSCSARPSSCGCWASTPARSPKGSTRALARVLSPPRPWATFSPRCLSRPCSRCSSPSCATCIGSSRTCLPPGSRRWIA